MSGEEQASLVSLYELLSEKEKVKLIKHLSHEDNELYKELKKNAGLDTGGFTDKKIKNRESTHIKKKIDAVLTNNSDLLKSILEKNFETGMCEFDSKFIQGICTNTKFRDPEEVIQEILKSYSSSGFVALFEQVTRQTKPHLFPTIPEGSNALDYLNIVEVLIKNIVEKRQEVDKAVKQLFILESDDEIFDIMQDIFVFSCILKRWLYAISNMLELSRPRLSSEEEIVKFVEVLRKKIEERLVDARAELFFQELGKYLELIEAKHRSSKQVERINSLIVEASVNLVDCSNISIILPDHWPSIPSAWIEWVLELDTTDFELVSNICAKVSTALVDFIEGVELNQIIKKKIIKTESITSNECSEKEEPALDVVSQIESEDTNSDKISSVLLPCSEEIAEKKVDPVQEAISVHVEVEDSPGFSLMTSLQLSGRIIEGERSDEILSALAWKHLRDNEVYAAFAISEYAEVKNEMDGSFLPPIWLCKLIILQKHYYTHSRAMNLGLQSLFAQYNSTMQNELSEAEQQAFSVMICSLALKMALVSQAYESRQILETPELGSVSNFYHMIQDSLEFVSKGQFVVTRKLLHASTIEVDYQERIVSVCSKAKELHRTLRQRRILTKTANELWSSWFGKTSKALISRILAPVAKNTEGLVEKVSDFIDELLADGLSEVADKHYSMLHRGELVAKAREQIVRHLKEVIEIAQEWIDLIEQHTAVEIQAQKKISIFKKNFSERYDSVVSELFDLKNADKGDVNTACLQIAINALQDIYGVLHNEWPELERISCARILRDPLLRYGHVEVKSSEEISDIVNSSFYSVLGFFNHEIKSESEIFQEFCDSGRHDLAIRFSESLRFSRVTEDLGSIFAKFSLVRENSESEWKNKILKSAKMVQNLAGLGMQNGYLSETEFVELNGISNAFFEDDVFDGVTRYDEIDKTLKVRITVAEAKKKEKFDEFQEKLKELKDVSDEIKSRIAELIKQGDLFTADNYLSLILRGLPLPEFKSDVSSFQDFFDRTGETDSMFHKLYKIYENNPLPTIIKRVESKSNLSGVSLGRISGKQAKEKYGPLLTQWFSAKRKKKISESAIRNILTLLDFEVKNVSHREEENEFIVIREPLKDRIICPIPRFGSEANGRYRIACYWDFPTEDILLTKDRMDVAEFSTILFYFGRLTELRRRELAQESRRRMKSFLVLDDVLLLHLCTQRHSPLPTLFKCSIPFTYVQTYNISSGYVAPEMFYGRAKELKSIKELAGSCVVYGGRQLGKTALLRKARDEFHTPQNGAIGIYLDLKSELIGRTLADIWPLLVKSFREYGILHSKTPDRTGYDKVKEQVLTWLSEKPGRRILLLLDEADNLLEYDSKQTGTEKFKIVIRLKDIMDKSHKRFKVVFSGLHNVQRTTRNPNNPLAHMGEPLCIGPLLSADAKEARNLIRLPFETMGYQFENEDLISRILAQTNYYPSLIQIYCMHLHRYLIENVNSFSLNAVPPYTITKQHVDQAYRSRNLRSDIRSRFIWTLDLDDRFRVITDIIALWGDEKTGISFTDIFRQLIDMYSIEMPAQAMDSFRAILEEMEGLGIVRYLDNDFFTFRSQNIVRLLGNKEEIEQDLEEALAKIGTTPLEVGDLRRSLEGYRLSVLTSSQESILAGHKNQVVMVYGCKATDTDHLLDSLKGIFNGDFLHSLLTVNDIDNLSDTLNLLTHEGKHCFYIPASCGWTLKWVRKAFESIKHRYSSKRTIKIVFQVDPGASWDLSQDFSGYNIVPMHLEPWTSALVREWIGTQVEWRNFSGHIEAICKSTGRWACLLYELTQKLQEPAVSGDIDELLSCIELNSERYSLFGIMKPIQKTILLTIALLDSIHIDTLAKELPSLDKSTIKKTVLWAEALGFFTAGEEAEGTSKVLNSFLSKLLFSEAQLSE